MIGYKAMNKDMTCRGFQYEVGKIYEINGKLEMCKNGFHFCENIVDTAGFYTLSEMNVDIYQVEALGNVMKTGIKLCTDKIKIVKKIPWNEIHTITKKNSDINIGYGNTGEYNTGNYNSGDGNSGVYNSGDYNTGWYNSGSRNSGDCNLGKYNSGDCNRGSFNSGYYNSGDSNSGDYNIGNYNSGFFNSTSPTVRLFNKDSEMTFDEFYDLGIDLFNLENSRDIIEKLPNYDAQLFYECTGIDWR